MTSTAITVLLEKRINGLEKKISTLVSTNMRVRLQNAEDIAKLTNAVDRLRKALPHVNFED